uniref:hypothetical protein n=1 Tax=Pseudomonas lundensis TaxID=86185 RepID=UPI001C30CD09
FEIGKAHLAHRRLGSGGQAYFSTFENLFGDSLREFIGHVYDKISGKLGVGCYRLLYGLYNGYCVGNNKSAPPLKGTPYWVVSGVVFLIIVTLGLRFYIPRLRNTW